MILGVITLKEKITKNTFQSIQTNVYRPNTNFKDLSEKVALECQHVILDIDKISNNDPRFQYRGIEILFWLRLYSKFTGKIICYSRNNELENILRERPDLVVLLSPEVYFSTTLNESVLQYLNIPTQKIYLYELKLFMKSYVKKQIIRHHSANKFAVQKIHKIYKEILNEEILSIEPIPDMTQEMIYTNLFGEKVKAELLTVAKSSIDVKIDRLEQELSILENHLIPLGKKGEKRQRPIDLILMHEKTIAKYGANKLLDRKIKYLQEKLDLIREEIVNKKNEIDQNRSLKTKGQDEEIEQSLKIKFKSRIQRLQITNTKFALIDDNATDGWYEVFVKLLGNNNRIVNIPLSDSIEEFDADALAEKIRIKAVDGIILDLRLFGDDDISNMPTGVELLKAIRKLDEMIPILVCTASNNAAIAQMAWNNGANFLWQKEGPDLEIPIEESLINIENLIDRLVLYSNQNIVRIYDLYRKYLELEEMENYWWEDKDWGFSLIGLDDSKMNEVVIVPSHSTVKNVGGVLDIIKISILDQFEIIENSLKNKTNVIWSKVANNIISLGRVIEWIHGFDEIQENFETHLEENDSKNRNQSFRLNSMIIKYGSTFGRGDSRGSKLYATRNSAAHYEEGKNLNINDALDYLEKFLRYLSKENTFENQNTCYLYRDYYYEDKNCKNDLHL